MPAWLQSLLHAFLLQRKNKHQQSAVLSGRVTTIRALLTICAARVAAIAPRLASRDVKGVAAYLASDACQRVVVLTGAGVSCAAGIPDFRSPGGMYDTLRPELITASPQERAAMARDPTAVVLKDLFLKNQFPYHEVRRPFILGTQRQ